MGELKFVKKAGIKKIGGSSYALVPPEIKEFLGLKEKDVIAYFQEEEKKRIIMIRAKDAKVVFPEIEEEAAMAFPLSKKDLENLVKKEE